MALSLLIEALSTRLSNPSLLLTPSLRSLLDAAS